jgi:hypothetical protein
MGEEVLPTARALADALAWPRARPDAAYGDVLGLFVIAYPAWVGWIVVALAAALWAAAARGAYRSKTLDPAGVAIGIGAGLLLLVGGALLLDLVRRATGVGSGWIAYRPLLARFALFEAAMALVGLSLILLLAWAVARRWPDTRGASWIGQQITALAAVLALQIAAPTIAPIVAWPLCLAAAAAALTRGASLQSRWAWAGAAALMTLGLAWLAALFHALLQGLDLPEAPALVIWLAAMLLWPLAWPQTPQRLALAPGALVLVVGLAIVAVLRLTSPWSARHPRAVEPQYLVEAGSGRAWRISRLAPDRWTLAALSADGGAVGWRRFAGLAKPVLAAPAAPVPAAAPQIGLSREPDGDVSLALTPARDAESVSLELSVDAKVTRVRLDGRPVALLRQSGQTSRLTWFCDQPFRLSFTPSAPGALSLSYAQTLPGWPTAAKPLPPMPADDMAWDRARATVAIGAARLAW